LKIWINAFIPRIVPDYTIELTQGQHTGKTVVPLPLIAYANPINWDKGPFASYLTDQRSFDADPSASVRMQSLAALTSGLTGWSIDGVGQHRSSGTTEVDRQTGEQLGFATAPMDRCAFGGLEGVEVDPGVPFTQHLYLNAAAADPLVSTAADIDYTGVFEIKTWRNPIGADLVLITWQVMLDAFPAFEGYVEYNGSVRTLFAIPPPAGNTVADLPGQANRSYGGVESFA
jgi:hypothetical protein